MIAALAMMSLSSTVSLFMTRPWQLVLTWGVVSGIGSGCITLVLSATIVNRWFVTNRGLVTGLFAASTSTGTLIFIPALSAIAENAGWKPVVMCVAMAMALLIPPVFFLLPKWPSDIGEKPFGAVDVVAPARANAPANHPAEVRERSNPLKNSVRRAWRGRAQPRFLAPGGHFLCLRLHHQRIGRHAHDRPVP